MMEGEDKRRYEGKINANNYNLVLGRLIVGFYAYTTSTAIPAVGRFPTNLFSFLVNVGIL